MAAKIIFANRYFHPDLSATSQMLSDLAARLARAGMEVHVVCSRQLYENPGAQLPREDIIDGVRVHRVWTARFGRGRLLGRALDYLSFYVTAGVRLFWLTRRGDVLVSKTDPPLLSVVGAVVAAMRRATLVNWLQDVFPEVAAHLYAGKFPRWAERVLQLLRDRSVRAAAVNVVLGARMREYLVSRGVAAGRVRVIENWADGVALRPKLTSESELRRQLALREHFVVAYSGNLGRAHEFDTLVEAASWLRAEPAFVFVIVGGGARLAALQARITELQLSSFRFVPYQPRSALSDVLAAGDVHLVCLLPELEGLIVPSKLYGILAAARPAVFVGDVHGEVAGVLQEAGCGISVPRGEGAELARQLRALHADSQRTQSMGCRSRALFEHRYTLERAVEEWLDMLAAQCGLPVSRACAGTARALGAM